MRLYPTFDGMRHGFFPFHIPEGMYRICHFNDAPLQLLMRSVMSRCSALQDLDFKQPSSPSSFPWYLVTVDRDFLEQSAYDF